MVRVETNYSSGSKKYFDFDKVERPSSNGSKEKVPKVSRPISVAKSALKADLESDSEL